MLTQIELKNFKCFEYASIPMKTVNILTGINGMGKSTVIQSLLLLRQSYQEQGRFLGLKLNGNYVRLGNGQDVLYEKAKEDEMVGIGLCVNDENSNYTFRYLPESDLLPALDKTEMSSENPVFGPDFVYLSAFRIDPKELYRVTNEENLKEREFGNNGEFTIQYLSVYGDDSVRNDKILLPDKKGEVKNTLSNQVRLWLNMISPGVSPQIKVDMQLRSAELKYEFIEGREKTNSYKSANVGFGITYVLPIIVALITAKQGDLIILENPEAHLHPAGQRKLGELIAAAGAGGAQIIAETHSDHVLNGMRIAVKRNCIEAGNVNFLYFYKDPEDGYRHKFKVPRIDSQGRISEWPAGFFDEWDNALLELLQ